MRIRLPYKSLLLCAIKITAGTAAALAVVLDGVRLGGCPPGTLCLSRFEMYAMRIDLWSIGVATLSIWLLLSALKGLLTTTSAIEIPKQGAESVANPNFQQMRTDYYWKIHYDM